MIRKVWVLCVAILFLSCNETKKENVQVDLKPTTTVEEFKNFDWLLGKWKRLNEEEGKATFEHWEKISKTEYSGIGFTMQNGDTIKQENIGLVKVGKQWDLVVKVPEETQSVTFKGVAHAADQFMCENNTIDFPNKIKYWKHGDNMHAMVSGGEMKIQFEFEKIK
ncbi:hypothetical protein V6246_08815 [Algibacter sp. TI.3.09]|uniref:hypothetical protein n=1 Tax=Algibacter sp. TI.3.09 TaxID=3121298 RepID=UPI00311D8355